MINIPVSFKSRVNRTDISTKYRVFVNSYICLVLLHCLEWMLLASNCGVVDKSQSSSLSFPTHAITKIVKTSWLMSLSATDMVSTTFQLAWKMLSSFIVFFNIVNLSVYL